MDAPGTVPETINCHQCSAPIDLGGQQAFTHVECGRCGALSVVPLKFGNFLLLQALGIGGMGTVYKAIDLSLNRYLAVKILRKKLAADPHFTDSFAREARAAASVNHPNVAQVYSFGEGEGQFYLALELLERGSLDDRITRLGKMAEKDVLDIGAQIAAGLRAAQQRGLLHRDIKPGNILFNEDQIPKLVDFGLARAQHEASTEEAGMVWGTPYYIAPEKLRGQTEDFRSDMYSLGATLFHALAGRPPFDAKTASEVVAKTATTPAFSLKTYASDTQDYTAHVIGRMLAKDPAERYETYDALIHDLHEAQRLLREASTAPAIVTDTGERVSILSIVGTVAALVVCVVVIWYVARNRAKLGLESSAPPTATVVTTQVASASTPVTTATGEEVDFNADEPWVKSWSVATLQLTQGKFNDAFFGYDGALYQIGRTRQRARQWVYYYEALALMASDRPGEARKLLAEKAKDPAVPPMIPSVISVSNFINPLVAVLLDELSLDDFNAGIAQMPGWAAGLAQLTVGFKQLEAGQFEKARDAFRKYHELPVDDAQQWAFNLQPLADTLVRDCDHAAATIKEIDSQKPVEALAALRAAKAKAKLPALRTALDEREPRLQKAVEDEQQQSDRAKQAAEARQREREEQQRAKAEDELKQLQALDAGAGNYDFKALLAKYESVGAKFETDAARQQLAQRQALARLLVEFKAQLSDDFKRRPYESKGLTTRKNVPLQGKLSRATDTEIACTNPYGELLINWSDLSPATLQKLGEFYATTFAPADKPASIARRYLTLAALAKQFGSERVPTYLKMAAQTMPAIQPEIEQAFGKDTAGN
jgi:serine/threonine protein kinase